MGITLGFSTIVRLVSLGWRVRMVVHNRVTFLVIERSSLSDI